MSALLRTYSRNFERRPYITLCVANGLLMSIGDVSAQIIGLSVRSPVPRSLVHRRVHARIAGLDSPWRL